MSDSNNYIYVCGFYSSDNNYLTYTLYASTNEVKAVNKMIDLCYGEYSWLFYNNTHELDEFGICQIKTYKEFNEFIKNFCNYYKNNKDINYLYIEKIKLE